jgi:hypothetical protein
MHRCDISGIGCGRSWLRARAPSGNSCTMTGLSTDSFRCAVPDEVALLGAWIDQGAEWPAGVLLTRPKNWETTVSSPTCFAGRCLAEG